MSREEGDPLFSMLVEEFETGKDEWIYEDVDKFVHWMFPGIWAMGNGYENNDRSGRMALGYVIMLPREQRDELWAKFQIERGE